MNKLIILLGVALGLAACTGALRAAGGAGAGYSVTSIDTAHEHLALFLNDEQGQPYRSFARLRSALSKEGKQLRFAMNGGMYEADGSPVGLLVIDGHELAPLNTAEGAGNFFLKPNGVFAMTRSGPRVLAANAYPALAAGVVWATQSGPMLLIDGAIHPAFSPTSTSRHIRNGVCAEGSMVHLVISRSPVTFHEFATYFKDVLGCRNALYLDGSVSSVFDAGGPGIGTGSGLGPLLGWVR